MLIYNKNHCIKFKQIIFLVLFLSIKTTTYSQLIIPKIDIPKYVIGFHSAGFVEFGKDSLKNHYHDILLETEPYFCYFPIKNLGFGVMFDYMYVNSTIHNYKEFYSVGILSRYYVPFQINSKMMGKEKIYFECNINLTNYEFLNRDGYPEVYNKMNKIRTNFAIGISINLVEELYLDFGFQYLTFINGISFFEPRFAIEYHFNKKTNNYE
ncbi:MAG: hypothetical protein JXL97_17150 [Bacteroidales bacterium]|nr:hypothetical protein [Bacteroidales bacterium]